MTHHWKKLATTHDQSSDSFHLNWRLRNALVKYSTEFINTQKDKI